MKVILTDWCLPPRILFNFLKFKALIKSYFRCSPDIFKKNIELKNIYTNKRCFILGTGPSLNDQDLTLLKNEIIIGVSGLFNHKDIEIIKPNYYILSPVFEYHSKYNKHESYIQWLQEMDKTLANDVVMILHIGDKKYIDECNIFVDKKKYWVNYIPWNEKALNDINLNHIPDILSVSEAAIHLALYLGFDKIYIMGFDHNWFEGLHTYFDNEEYNKYFENTGKKAVEKFGFDSEYQMIRHAKIFRKYKMYFSLKKNIYNANSNKNSYVDVFPKKDYKNLVSENARAI